MSVAGPTLTSVSTSFPAGPDAVERADPDLLGPELDNLVQFLDYHRQTFVRKCAGLDEEQLKRRAAPPSTLSLLGLARHLSDVERHWFVLSLDGRDLPDRYSSGDDPDGDFDDLDSIPVAEVWANYRAEVTESRRILATFSSPDDRVRGTGRRGNRTVRWVLLHLIEEYARHNGHADLLREAIDGETGE
ncbi:DinB family protein [Microlunatus ginsengisoli]|uniref:DinB family protein n=1 Tax=Microlunatus ginsengisoli TaxID=363863 RepID=A0ABP7AFN9_9ACTN